MKLSVDHDQRFAKMRAHTATHMLHAELAKIFPNTKQAGSLVDDDYLRFDFVADRLLTQEEIDKINKHINQTIYFAFPVKVDETSYKDALKLWAKAFFEEKYGDEVRVVQIVGKITTVDGDEAVKSIELCGGTHVENTKDIWCFIIVSQEAVASGVKRITAFTGPKVYERVQEVQYILDTAIQKLGIKTATQLEERLDKVMKEYDEMKKKMWESEIDEILDLFQWAKNTSNKYFPKIIDVGNKIAFKSFVIQWIVFFEEDTLLYNSEWSFAILSTKKKSSKKIAQELWLKWWWSDSLFQGKDEKVLWLFK